MKLIIQIPCLNEAQTLPSTLADLPGQIEGIDQIEVLVIDDGSTDGTAETARQYGVDHICRHQHNLGLARAFRSGLERALELGADIIVNTDGDGQYTGDSIPALIKPIVEGEADIVIGDRQTALNPEFSPTKKRLQWLGSLLVRNLSGTDVPDAVSGFRAISRSAALKLNILTEFSYTVEMIIQAGNKRLAVTSVPVATNPKTRESRLFKSMPQFISNQGMGMIRMYAMYRPLRFFFYLGTTSVVLGLIPVIRFLYYSLMGDTSGKIQSLVLGSILLITGFTFFVSGLLADLISRNRQLSEMALESIRELKMGKRSNC